MCTFPLIYCLYPCCLTQNTWRTSQVIFQLEYLDPAATLEPLLLKVTCVALVVNRVRMPSGSPSGNVWICTVLLISFCAVSCWDLALIKCHVLLFTHNQKPPYLNPQALEFIASWVQHLALTCANISPTLKQAKKKRFFMFFILLEHFQCQGVFF